MALEAPLAHMVAGAFFLLQAAALGTAILTGAVSSRTGLTSYLILLLLGWAGGVVLGHLGKLLSLSLWVWWPPGPRPKQAALYPRWVWLVEAAAFAAGVESLAIGALVGSLGLTVVGGTLLLVAAGLAVTGASLTWVARWRCATKTPSSGISDATQAS
jgi:hypothetical protein